MLDVSQTSQTISTFFNFNSFLKGYLCFFILLMI